MNETGKDLGSQTSGRSDRLSRHRTVRGMPMRQMMITSRRRDRDGSVIGPSAELLLKATIGGLNGDTSADASSESRYLLTIVTEHVCYNLPSRIAVANRRGDRDHALR